MISKDEMGELLASPAYQKIILLVSNVLDDNQVKVLSMGKRATLEDFKYETGHCDGIRAVLSVLKGEL